MLQVYVTSGSNLVSGQRKEQLNSNAACYVRVTALGCNGRQTIIGYTDISSKKGPSPSFDVNRLNPFKIPFVAASKIRFDVILGKIKIKGIANENANLISTATIQAKPFDSHNAQKIQLNPPSLDSLAYQEEEGGNKHKFIKLSTGYDSDSSMGTLEIAILPDMIPFDKIVQHKHSFERQNPKRIFVFMSTPDNFQQTEDRHLELEIIQFNPRGEYPKIQKNESQFTTYSDFFNGTKIFDFTLESIHNIYYEPAVESVGDTFSSNPVDVVVKFGAFISSSKNDKGDERFFILKEQTIHIDRSDVYSTGSIFWNYFTSFHIIDRSTINVAQVTVSDASKNAITISSAPAPVSLTLSSDMRYRTQGGQNLEEFAKRIAPKVKRNYERPTYSMEARRIMHPANNDSSIFTVESITHYWNDIFPCNILCSISAYDPDKLKTIELRCFLYDEFFHNIDLKIGHGTNNNDEFSSQSGFSSEIDESSLSESSHLLGAPSSVSFHGIGSLDQAFARKSKSSIVVKLNEVPLEVKYIYFTCLTSSDVNVDAQFKLIDASDGFNIASTEVVVFNGKNCRNLIVFYRKKNLEWDILELNNHQSLHKSDKMVHKIASNLKESIGQVNPQKAKTLKLVQNRRKSLF